MWLDHAEIPPGASIADFAWRGIGDADAVVFLFSAESVHSPWVSMELAAALSLRAEHPAKKIIPVMVGKGVKVPPLLYDTKFVTIDSEDSVEKASGQIVDAIKSPEARSTEAASNAYRMLEVQTMALRAVESAWINQTRSRLSTFALYIASAVVSAVFLALISAVVGITLTVVPGIQEHGNSVAKIIFLVVTLIVLTVTQLLPRLTGSASFHFRFPWSKAKSQRPGEQ